MLFSLYLCRTLILEHMKHFDEETAKAAVAPLGSGEHWTFDQVIVLVTPYIRLMGYEDTMWDAYVALNKWWCDLGDNYTRRHLPECYLVEDALTFAFVDRHLQDAA